MTQEEGERFCISARCGCNNFRRDKVISYNIQKKSLVAKKPRVVHRAEALEDNDDYCSTECGRWLDTDQYIVTTAPVTCARCLLAALAGEGVNGR